ncbi:type III secretion protein [Proteus vulgaris]|uniref:Type III secretion protein n=1 Tax=Proteus faecis TaxID=2050967 RepID=A0ABZ3EKR9_9GAMM|nr:type III secretion protein [Proteus faecis]MCT8250301.1 type III secretion protein [Proteus faecis]MDM3869188.1 type III secretion protein [Proteus faecis]QNH65412.1 type III secretion protein [Proteus vulgaris]
MLRSVPEKLLDYTCEGVLIRARYIRQLDNIHKINLATKNNAKKLIRDTEEKLKSNHDAMVRQGYSEGLKTLLGDILTLFSQYQTHLFNYELKQRELIINTVAQYFQSPDMQIELTKQLIAASPLDHKLTLNIPKTLQPYLEKALSDQNVEFIPHDNTTISVSAGSQILFFDPPLFMQDLKAQFHQPYTEKNQLAFSQELKTHLINYIQQFELLESQDENQMQREHHNED